MTRLLCLRPEPGMVARGFAARARAVAALVVVGAWALGLLAHGGAAWAQRPDLLHEELVIRTRAGAEHRFRVELADTPDAHERGLMFRLVLAPDEGMLFDFHRPVRIAMWMKDTLIPLDMLFIDASGRIVALAERTEPLSLDAIDPGVAVRAVLEIGGGVAQRLGIGSGDTVHHRAFGTQVESAPAARR